MGTYRVPVQEWNRAPPLGQGSPTPGAWLGEFSKIQMLTSPSAPSRKPAQPMGWLCQAPALYLSFPICQMESTMTCPVAPWACCQGKSH